jgi:hypothetical protein
MLGFGAFLPRCLREVAMSFTEGLRCGFRPVESARGHGRL